MSTRILPEGRAPWLDAAGRPLDGGKIYTYEPSTTTNKPTYYDQAKVTAHANPIILDADGRPPAPIYWDGEYKYVVKTKNDALVYSQDSYGDEPASFSTEGASLLPNGGFETDSDGDSKPDEWTITELASNTVTLDTTSGNVKSGSQSLKFTTTDGGQAGTAASALIPWIGGETLYLGGWTKSSAVDFANTIVAYWYSDLSTVLSSTTLYTDSGTAPTTFTEINVSAAAPSGAKFAQIRINGADGGGVTLGSSWFDSITVESLYDDRYVVGQAGTADSEFRTNVQNDARFAPISTRSFPSDMAVRTWTARAAAEANEWESVAWSPELSLFAAVSGTGINRVMTSPNGTAWTARAAAEANAWNSVTWAAGLGLFVAVASTGTNRVMTSPDGITWTARAASLAQNWISVTWSESLSLLVAVSTDGINRVMTSPDGITWKTRPASEASSWREVTWSPDLSLFVAVAVTGTNRVMTSPDGITWTAVNHGVDLANTWRAVAWSPELSLFAAVGSGTGTNKVMTSPDGATWTARTAAEDNFWYGVAWSASLDLFVAVAGSGTNRVMTSPDGITWTARTASEANIWESIAWADEQSVFVAVSSDGTNRVMHSL